MSGLDTRQLLDQFLALVMLPAIAAHELAHAAVAWPWASTVSLDRRLPPRLALEYPQGTPVAAVVLANLAPTLLGAALAPVAVPAALGVGMPGLVYLLGAYALFTTPSRDDLAVLASV